MRSQRLSRGVFYGPGIPMAIISFIMVIIGGIQIGEKGERHVTVIHGESGSATFSNDINWGAWITLIIGILLLSIALTMIILGFISRKDYVEINFEGVIGCNLGKYFSYKYSEIESLKANPNSVTIKTKYNDKPFNVLFLKNAEQLSKEFHKIKEGGQKQWNLKSSII